MTRKYTKKILELMHEGVLNKEYLIRDLLNWLPEEEVQAFFEKRIAYDNDYFNEENDQ